MSRGSGRSSSWGRLGEGRVLGNYGKAVPEDLNLKFRSRFNHTFTNHGCLHYAIPKTLYSFKEKRAGKQGIVNFCFKFFKMRFSRFWKCLKAI